VPVAQEGQIIIVDRPGSPQSLILGGLLAPPTGVDNNIAINAMNDVIGGSFTARVNMNLREDKGWAYGASTILYSAKGQRPYLAYAPVQSDKTALSLAEIVKEFNQFLTDRPATPSELSRVVNNSSRALPGQFETASAVLGSMMRNNTYGRPDNFVETLPQQFRALTIEDVMAAAKQVIHPSAFTWLVIGDAAQIKASLEALELGPVSVREAAQSSGAR
jgi:zinc protease